MPTPLPHRNPLPQLTPARVRRLKAELQQTIWSRRQRLDVRRSDEQIEPVGFEQVASLPLRPLLPGDTFGRGGNNWTSFWMRIEVPAADDDEAGRRFLHFRCQGETTVWIDGQPWAGLDLGHETCPLPDQGGTLWLECCAWQTGIWIAMSDNQGIGPHGIRFESAELAVRDPTAWDTYCDLDVIVQWMEHALAQEPDLKLSTRVGYCRALETASPRLRRLLVELDAICDLWQETSDLAALQVVCRDLFRRWPAEPWQATAAVCGHAHIDLVWLWPESATRKKVVHSMATVLRLLDRYPEFVFVQSMPALYRMLENESPELMAQIKPHIQSGRWEVVGGFEVEPDTNLPGGEALARSIVIGQRKIEELTGQPSDVAWIPDVFGYSQCLPQILAQGGVKYFYTTKMTWSNITKFPYTSLVWRGGDGTEVLAHLSTTDYNGEMRFAAHDGALADHRQAGVHPEMLLPTGYGDGGGGPTELHIERGRRMGDLSGAARVRWTRADAFFSRMERVRDHLPVYQGELYLEYHRGTYTTQSEFKRLYRLAERGLQAHEAVRAATAAGPLPESSWIRLCFAHFHDAIPGSSIAEVYAEMNPELKEIGSREESAATALLDAATADDSPGRGQFAVFNTLPYARTATVEQGGSVFQVRLPALGGAPLDADADVENPIVEATRSTLRNGRLTARFDADGQWSELILDGRPLPLAGRPGFMISPDDPVAFDAWEIDHHAARAGTRIAEKLTLKVVEEGPARAVLESEPVPIGASSTLRVRYILEAGSTHLRIEPTVAWRESHALLRFFVPTHYRGRHARFGCPFGAIERPQQPGNEADEAMWEVPGSRWAAVQHDGGVDGLAIVAESKLGYSARDGTLAVSLLRAPKWPDATADLGTHTLPFAIGRLHTGTTATDLCTSMSADALFCEPLAYSGAAIAPRFEWLEFGTLNASWCGPSLREPGAYFIRLHETAGRPGTARLRLLHPTSRAEQVDLREALLSDLDIDTDGNVAIEYRPWQLLTVRIHP